MLNEDIKIEQIWQPIFLTYIERIIEGKIYSEKSNCYEYGLKKNICYNLQYLEFVCKHCFDEIKLTTVLQKQNYKIFVIVSSSIIEGILYHEIRKNDLLKNRWRLFKIFKSNPIFFKENNTKIESHYFEKVSDYEDIDMTFDQMLKIAENKNLLGIEHDIYGKIKIMRTLRNKIHIHLAKNNLDTDYNTFDYKKFDLAKSTLLEILRKYFLLEDKDVNNCFKYLL